jgi:DNA-binding response OmpR family regulator
MENKKRILVVDDEQQITMVMRSGLTKHGFDVRVASEGESALELFQLWTPDLVITDLSMPNMDGLEVCRRLRAVSTVPIIVLSVKGDESVKIEALDAGADDYVTKPFSPRELVARVATVLRRVRRGPRVISAGGVEIDLTSREVRRDGVVVPMTPAEFRLLEVLASNPGRAWTRTDLGERAFGLEYDALDRTIDAHVMNLRRKLERDRAKPDLIQTVFGVGYRFRASSPHV